MAQAPEKEHIIYDYLPSDTDDLSATEEKSIRARRLIDRILADPIAVDPSMQDDAKKREIAAQQHYRNLAKRVLEGFGVSVFDLMTPHEAGQVLKLIQEAADTDSPQPREQEVSHAA